jgi:hypothetical protein
MKSHLAGVLEHNGALRVLQVLVEPHTRSALAQDADQRGLANLDRLPSKIAAVQLEGGQPALVTAHLLAIDQALEVVHVPPT